MSTIINNFFAINGVIDTSKDVMSNMRTLASASSSWITFDIHAGKWSVIVNEASDSVTSFTDNNIIGGIIITTSGLAELYNKVQLEFPHKDLNDQIDTITYSIPSNQRYPYEVDNTLNFQFDCINNPSQAEYLAALELKQNRVDKVIKFKTDFTQLGLKAGDIIDITSSMHGFTNKKFRILSISEEDVDDGSIGISITAFEYDSSIYSTSGLIRTERTTTTGIVGNCANSAIANSEQAANEISIMKLLTPLAASYALNGLWNMLFPKIPKALAEALNSPSCTITSDDKVCEGSSVTVTINICSTGTCTKFENLKLPYTITGVSASDIGIPLTGDITFNSSGVGVVTIPITSDNITEGTESLVFTCNSTSKTIVIYDFKGYTATANPGIITEGQSTAVTFTTRNIPNGAIPYAITGSGLSQLITASTGTVTISNNTATLTVQTRNASTSEAKELIVTLDPTNYYCGSTPATISLTNTVTPPPPDTNCEWVDIPVAWCGTFNSSGVITSVFPVSTMTVLKAITGQSSKTVPLTASTNGTTITVTSTVSIDASTSQGGRKAQVITTFANPISGVKRVLGSATTEVIGW
jgi:hypothetical protein